MAFSYACLTLQRVVIPIVLVLAALFRPVGISFVYLLMFFISPFIPVATSQNFKGSVTAYLIILIALSTILILCHIGLQIAIFTLGIESAFRQCAFTEQLLRHIGFIDFFKLNILAIVEWLSPEVAVFITSIAIYLVTKKIVLESSTAQLESVEGGLVEDGPASINDSIPARSRRAHRSNIKIKFEPLVKIAPLFCLATLFFAAVLRPSIPGGFYFLFFLISGSYWATFQSLQRGFAVLIRFVMAVLILHIISIVSYQTPWMQQNVGNNTLVARLVGLEPLITSSCAKDIRIIFYESWFKLDSFLSPIAILFSYYTLALTSKNLIKLRSGSKPLSAFGQLENGTKTNRQLSISTRTTNASKKDSWSKTQRLNMSIQQNQRSGEPTETTPLVRHKKPIRINDGDAESRIPESGVHDIPMDQLDKGIDPEKEPSLCDQICYGIISIGGFIYQNSYIFTNILMMAWSIVYHSWLTFVFLLWANVLWMIPNQRKAMMRSSPFVVFYAEVLLIAQYIYGMNLNNDELPTSVTTKGINLQQIGLERPSENQIQPCIPLIVKTSFLLMFWVTLRQFFKEKNERRRHSTIADMVAPLQLTVSAAAADLNTAQNNKKTSKFLKKAGDIIKNILVRLWIWLLILVIFLCAITGVKMTLFRIFYMAIFLLFLLVFQSSSKAWVKLMYGFWLYLIFDAMLVLTLTYTYQFDKFDQYLNDYLNLSKTMQEDIGLKKYETKDLFLHLVSPTIIVILTVIQVHYFHKRFVAALQHQSVDVPQQPSKSLGKENDGEFSIKSKNLDSLGPSNSENHLKASLKDLFRRCLLEFKIRARHLTKHFKGVCWRFLELHLIKAVYISAFACCVSEVCVLHIIFCALCLIGVISKNSVQTILSRVISLAVSLTILTKMVYQVQYIPHEIYNVECNNTGTIVNSAIWFGLQKATVNAGLMGLIKKYIIFMVMVTLHAVVVLRQSQMRAVSGTTNANPPKVLFPGVKRADAENNLAGMIKYLFNYGFYKFGMEFTLIALVSLITYRQDVVAIFYVFWLCTLLWFKRSICAKIWSIFQCFTATLIFLEYLLLVGLPPGLCIEYPWDMLPNSAALQKWAMLPGHTNYNHVNKLMFDFVLLLFINRQKKAFNVESRMQNNDYPGGSNKSVIRDIENLGRVEFENPTRDFLSTIRNYLDIIKNVILCGFYWITLAVVFLAGTNISDLLAIGYLIGAFVFLWQGSDFYLKPIRAILRWWNYLLIYNVLNITIKTFLQIGGCLFLNMFQTNACWLIHMLGIVCADGGDDAATETDECPALKSNSVLVWDSICFAFLILQLRIFKSHYFCHIINDTKANTILAYRGAEIIEELRQKQIEHRNEHEQQVLRKIKRKMEKIRATQQKMLRPIDKPTHFDEEAPPLLRSGSFSSCHGSGYHTPIDDEDDDYALQKNKIVQEEFASDIASKDGGLMPYAPGRQSHQIHSPSSGGLTISFDGFLDTNRLSFDSTAGSDLLPKPASSDESCGVFSPPAAVTNEELSSKGFFKNDRLSDNCLPMSGLLPPPTTAQTSLMVNTSGGSSVISSTQHSRLREHRRQSSVNAVSWNEPVSETLQGKDIPTAVVDITEDVPVTLRQKSLHRRHLSMGNATYSVDENTNRQRYSNLSAPDEVLSRRPNSWGPVDNVFYSESLILDVSRATSHAESIRAGDYYMFDDMDEKFELELIEDEVDFLEDQGKIDESEKKMTRRKNLFEVYKEISNDRKKSFSRQRSYASAPGSRIGIKSVEPDLPRASVISDPLVYPYSCSGDDNEKIEKPKSEKSKMDIPSTSKDVPPEDQSGAKRKTETDSAGETDQESDDTNPPNPILRLLEGFMVSVVIRLNRLSRNYRYVMKILAEEKKILKESKVFERSGSASTVNLNISTALVNMKKPSLSDDEASNTNALNSQSNTEIHDTNTTTTTAALHQPLVDINEIQLDTIDAPARKDTGSQASLSRPIVRRSSGVPGIRVMAPSVELGLDETGTLSEEWSYEKVDRAGDFTYEEDFTTRDHHIIIEALISAWYAILSNTDLICYIVVFINQVRNASIISLPLPLMVFLWGTLSLPRPSKTFWITLITYTQCLVLVKCIFQYKLIWSNYINLENQPLDAAKLIGVELSKHYANYDLILLLVLFFHRFVLKTQGLWKSEYKNEVMTGHALVLKEDASSKNIADDDTIVSEEQTKIIPRIEDSNDQNLQDENSLQTSGDRIPRMSKFTKNKYFASCGKFFLNLVHKSRLPADVYALMFVCDFINFFVLLFGFTAFGSRQGEESVQAYLVENKVPIPFLIMLLIQFILIVIDRALYLRKALVYKIIFHFFSVIGIHIWMFFVIPAVTERSFYSLAPPIIFYIVKCFYLLLSSFQIKCGYPKRILGNFLTKSFSMVNLISFKVYMLLPFLFELRTILDWVSTDSTMTVFDWLKMEDIFSQIYFIKCGRQMETDFPAMRAQKKAMFTKIFLGGTIILVIVIIIWGPLCLFALGNAVGQSNVPYEVSASIRIGPYDPIYDTNNRESIYMFDSEKFSNFQNAYKKNRSAITFLSNYDESDIAVIILKGNSPSLWMISPPDKVRLLDDLINNKTLICRFTYSFERTPPVKNGIGMVSDEITYALDENFSGRKAMIEMLQGNITNENNLVVIPKLLPKFIKVPNSGELNFITQLLPENDVYRPLEIRLHTSSNSSEGIWWEIKESCNDTFYKTTLSQLPYSKCDSGIVMYTFNDKKFPSTFSLLTAGGIMGLYTTFVFVASRFLRSFIGGQSTRIMFEDLPYVDRVLQLCLDIYLVREALEFALEEDLFAKLLFLYRSPETMIKWTRPKEESNEDETDTESLRSRNSHRRTENM